MPHTAIPIIDLADGFQGSPAANLRLAQRTREGCQSQGIFLIRKHGISTDLIERFRTISNAFFNLHEHEKLRYRRPTLGQNRGYFTLQETAIQAADIKPDLRRLFTIGPIDVPDDDYYHCAAAHPHFAANIWPSQPTAFEPTWRDYYRAMTGLGDVLMRVFALALDLPETCFQASFDRHTSLLRAADYPPQDTLPDPGQLRCSPHTDLSILTIIHIDDVPGGLQIEGADGAWVDVPYQPDTLVVLLGDLIKIYTNDLWIAPRHRVANPPIEVAASSRRQSIQFFYQPNYDAVLSCVPSCISEDLPPSYPDVTLSDITALYALRDFSPV